MAELTPTTPDRALTVPELAEHFDRSETWVKRLIRSAHIDPIGKIHTGARGRPGSRYSLSDVATSLRDRLTAKRQPKARPDYERLTDAVSEHVAVDALRSRRAERGGDGGVPKIG